MKLKKVALIIVLILIINLGYGLNITRVKSIESENLQEEYSETEFSEVPEIYYLRTEGDRIVIKWFGVKNNDNFQVKIDERIYETEENYFEYPANDNLDGKLVRVREKIDNGYTNWSNTKTIKTKKENIENDNLYTINNRASYSQYSMDNLIKSSIDQNLLDYKLSVFGDFNFTGQSFWTDMGDSEGNNFFGGTVPIKKFKFISVKKPNINVKIKYQAYLYDEGLKTGGWQSVKSEGQEAGEDGKVITSVRIWLEGINYDIRYNAATDLYSKIPDISEFVKNGKEVYNSDKNKKPITSIKFEIIEQLPNVKVEAYGNYNGVMKWSNNKNDYTAFVGPNSDKISKLKLSLNNKAKDIKISYQVYIKENTQWQDWKTEGEEAGEDGKTITNLRAKIEGDDSYLLRYNFKTLLKDGNTYISDYAQNGKEPMESNSDPIVGAFFEICKGAPELKVYAYSDDIDGYKSWIPSDKNGRFGVDSYPINKFMIKLVNKPKGTKIKYQVYLKKAKKWQEWKEDGQIAGVDDDEFTTLRIKLEGETLGNSIKYDFNTPMFDSQMYYSQTGYNGVEPSGSLLNTKSVAGVNVSLFSSANIKELDLSKEEVLIDKNYEIPENTVFTIPAGKKIRFDYSKTPYPGFKVDGTLKFEGTASNNISITDNNGKGKFEVNTSGKLVMNYVNLKTSPQYNAESLIKNKGELALSNSTFDGSVNRNIFIENKNSKGVTIEKCNILNWKIGVVIDGKYNVAINNSKIDNNEIGILVEDGDDYSSDTKIDILNNISINNNMIGIYVSRSKFNDNPNHKKLNIKANNLDSNKVCGIMFNCNNLSNIEVANNSIKNTNKLRKDYQYLVNYNEPMEDGKPINDYEGKLFGGPIYIKLTSIEDKGVGTTNFLKNINSKDQKLSNTITGNNIDAIVLSGSLFTNLSLTEGKHKYAFDYKVHIESGSTLLLEKGTNLVIVGYLFLRGGNFVSSGDKANNVTISAINDKITPVPHVPLTNGKEEGFSITIAEGTSYNATFTNFNGGGVKSFYRSAITNYGNFTLSNCKIDNGKNKDLHGITASNGEVYLTETTISNAEYGILNFTNLKLINTSIENCKYGIWNNKNDKSIILSKCNIENNTNGIMTFGTTDIYNSNFNNTDDNIAVLLSNEKKLTLLQNNITGSQEGIKIYECNPKNVDIKYNNIYGNSMYGLFCNQPITAQYNYWGNKNGPSGKIYYTDYNGVEKSVYRPKDGYGDSIYDKIYISPYVNSKIEGVDIGIDEDQISKDAYSMLTDYSYNLKKVLFEDGINPASGNYVKSYTDMFVKSNGIDINISRGYSSMNDKEGMLGKGWALYYESKMIDFSEQDKSVKAYGKVVTLPGGSVSSFQKETDGSYKAIDSRNKLNVENGIFVLIKKDGMKYYFDKSGYLTKIVDKKDNKILLEYKDNKLQKIYDEIGREYLFNYSNSLLANIQEKVDGVNTRNIIYNYENNLLKSVVDVNGNTQETFSYDSNKKLCKITKADKDIEEVKYYNDEANKGKIENIKYINGLAVNYTYNNENRSVVMIDNEGKRSEIVYDSNFRATYTCDNEGNSTVVNYALDSKKNNILGEEIYKKDKFGYVTEYQRDTSGNIELELFPDLTKKEYKYDNNNNVIKEVEQDGTNIFYVYDKTGVYLKKKVIPLDGKKEYSENLDKSNFAITEYEYYSKSDGVMLNGLIKRMINPEGEITEYSYDKRGNITAEKHFLKEDLNKDGVVDDKDTDLMSKLYNLEKGDPLFNPNYDLNSDGIIDIFDLVTVSRKYGSEDKKSYTYDKVGNKETESDVQGNITTYQYDKKGKVLNKIDALKQVYSYKYDKFDRLNAEISPNMQGKLDKNGKQILSNEYSYDDTENLKMVKDSLGNIVGYEYDKYGNKVKEINGKGGINIYEYDILGRVICAKYQETNQATPIILQESSYEVEESNAENILNNEVKVIEKRKTYSKDNSYNQVINKYNYQGNIVETINEDNSKIISNFDGEGKLISKSDEKNSPIFYYYDIYNNLSKKYEPVSFENGSIKYRLTKLEYNKDGNKTGEKIGLDLVNKDEEASKYYHKKYDLDERGRVFKETDSEGRKIEFKYDKNGNIKYKYEYKSESDYIVTNYQYDSLNRMIQESVEVDNCDLVGNELNDTSTGVLETKFNYDKNSNITLVTLADGSQIQREFDDLNRLTKTTQKVIGNGSDLRSINEVFTYEGNTNKIKTHINGEGNKVVFSYNNKFDLVNETYDDGTIKSYAYDLTGNKISTTTQDGYSKKVNKLSQEYDKYNRVILEKYETKDVAGKITELPIKAYKYDILGNVIKEVNGNEYKNASGNTVQDKIENSIGTEYIYDLDSNVTSVLMPESKAKGKTYTFKFENDVLGRQIKQIDSEDNVMVSNIDFNGNLLKKELTGTVNGTEKKTVVLEENKYDLLNNKVSSTDGNRNVKEYKFNSIGEIKEEKLPGDGSIPAVVYSYQYDKFKNVSVKVSSSGIKEEMKWDSLDNLIYKSKISKDGKDNIKESYEYNNNSSLKKYIDAEGVVKTYKYDIRGNVIETRVNEIVKEKNTYDSLNNIISSADRFNNKTSYEYDELGRLKVTKDAYDVVIEERNYNLNGKVDYIKDAQKNKVSYEYDLNGNLTKTTDDLGLVSSRVYNELNEMEINQDGNGNKTSYTYDALGKIIKVQNELKEMNYFTYDLNGNMTSFKDGKGNITTYEYNVDNEISKIIAPNSGNISGKVQEFKYNSDGSLISGKDRNGNVLSYAYDDFGRKKEESDGKNTIKYNYDKVGNLKEVKNPNDPTGDIYIKYDDEYRIIEKKTTKSSTPSSNQNLEAKFNYIYDVKGEREGEHKSVIKDSKGGEVVNTYDKMNRLTFVNDGEANIEYKYNLNGSKKQTIFADGKVEDYTYNKDQTLNKIIQKNKTAEAVKSYEYSYDSNKNITSVKDSKGTTTLKYDKLNRLDSVKTPDLLTVNYDYDKVGNRIKEEVTNGQSTVAKTYDYDEENRLKKVVDNTKGNTLESVFSYDNNGNLTSEVIKNLTSGKTEKNRSLIYDSYNRLIELKDDNVVKQKNYYNFSGMRVKKDAEGKSTQYYYGKEGTNVLLETNSIGEEKARNTFGTELISRKANGVKGYYRYNGHGDVEEVFDINGGNLAKYHYDSFGNITEDEGEFDNPYRYSGYVYDEETEYYYLRARMYTPEQGRFIQEDTYRGKIEDPLTLNLYTYCLNNPLIYDDQNGHWPDLSFISNGLNWMKDRVVDGANWVKDRVVDGVNWVKDTAKYISDRVVGSLTNFTNTVKVKADKVVTVISKKADEAKDFLKTKADEVYNFVKNIDVGQLLVGGITAITGVVSIVTGIATLPLPIPGARVVGIGLIASGTTAAGYGTGEVLDSTFHINPIKNVITSLGVSEESYNLIGSFSGGVSATGVTATSPYRQAYNGSKGAGVKVDNKTNTKTETKNIDSSKVGKDTVKANADASYKGATEAVNIPGRGYHKEVYANRPVKVTEAVDKWDEFLGPGEYTDIHPRTGLKDPDRIFSADGKKSIRFGSHEMNSKPSKFHYHEEIWTHDRINNVMNVDNTVVRVPYKN